MINNTRWGLILLLAVLISFCHSCQSVNKALVKVLGNDSATNVILKLHPCAIAKDSMVSSIDTVNTSDTIINTVYHTDTLHHWQHDTTTRTINKYATIHDTLQHYQLNQRALDAMNSSLSDAGKTISGLQQSVVDEKANCMAKDKWLWLFIVAVIAFCLSNALWIWSKFK